MNAGLKSPRHQPSTARTAFEADTGRSAAVPVKMPEAVEKRICGVRRADLRSQIAAGLRADPGTQARIACSNGQTPMIAITRLML